MMNEMGARGPAVSAGSAPPEQMKAEKLMMEKEKMKAMIDGMDEQQMTSMMDAMSQMQTADQAEGANAPGDQQDTNLDWNEPKASVDRKLAARGF